MMKLDYDQQQYFKTIIVDFDDTLSITTTKDWKNSEPNNPVISKINDLYSKGWQVIVLTARGQLSCNGDTALADQKYRVDIENWLNKHNVKYTALSFNKYLAAYYIDDKSILPNDFVELDIRDLNVGWSNAVIQKRGNFVYKTHDNALNTAFWYRMAAPLINTPQIYSFVGNTLCMEYLESTGKNFKIDELNNYIEKFSMYQIHNPFSKDVTRIKNHIDVNVERNVLDVSYYVIIDDMIKHTDHFNQYGSFCHGDMSLENIIQTERGLYLIDPIYEEGAYSSFLLDVAKLAYSYRRHKRVFEYEVFVGYWKKKYDFKSVHLLLLEITQFLRVLKYCPENLLPDVQASLTEVMALYMNVRNK